jgi:hypothetical protein
MPAGTTWTAQFGESCLVYRLNSVGAVAATVLSLLIFATPASSQQSPLSPSAASPHGVRIAKAAARTRRPFRPAYVLATINLQSGPGSNYNLIQVIPEGSTVGVDTCSGGWCATVWKRRRGFAPADALSIAQAGPDGSYPPYEDEPGPAYAGGPASDASGLTFSVGAGVDVLFGYGPSSRWHRRW